jgi:hexosaminidase
VISRPHSTPYGEFAVHQDRCDGPVLATASLPNPATSTKSFALDAKLATQHGEHTLCMVFTAPTDGPLYAIDSFSLIPVADTKIHP